MTRRRDLFLLVAKPDRVTDADAFLERWLSEIDGHPGYLGGSVLRESAGELPGGTRVLVLEFESTAAAKALWPKIEGKLTPIEPEVPGVQSPDQGGVLFDHDGSSSRQDAGHGHDHAHTLDHLTFNRGGGLFARLLHVHSEIAYEYEATGTGPGSAEVAASAS